MTAVAAQNPRVGDPVYHVVLSWPAGESPTDDEAFACGAHAVAAVGMTDHQYVFAIHRDTSHVHLHMAVNRVNPDTFVAVYPERDFFKLDRAMRELELRNGWQHDRGPYAVFERNGMTVIDWRSKSPDSKGKQPTAARDMERHADQESFFSYVRGEPRVAVVAALKREDFTWEVLHEVLGRYGLELREKGQGFAIHDQSSTSTTPVKASDMHEQLSKARLIRRLGPFVASQARKRPMEAVYDKHRPPKRDPARREQRRQERADARRGLRSRYAEYSKQFVYQRVERASVRARYAAIRQHAFDRRTEVRNTISDRAARKAMYSVIAFETLRAQYRLRAEIREERLSLRNDPSNKRWSYREWIERQAAHGDAAAISQLRGFAYQAQRELRRAASDVPVNAIVHDEDLDPVVMTDLEGMTYTVRRDGSVLYRRKDGGDGFVDHGHRIEILSGGADPSTVDKALHLAAQRFGNRLDVVGTTAFRTQVVEGLVRGAIPATLKDAALEAMRQQRARRSRDLHGKKPPPGGRPV